MFHKKIIGAIAAMIIIAAGSASPFTLSKTDWFEVMVPIRIALDTGKISFGMEMNYFFTNTSLGVGGRILVEFSDRMYFTFAMNGIYLAGIDPVKEFAVPVVVRAGLLDSMLGIGAAAGVQAAIMHDWDFKLNLRVLYDVDFRFLPLFCSEKPGFSMYIDTAAGFATIDSKGGGSGGYTYYYY